MICGRRAGDGADDRRLGDDKPGRKRGLNMARGVTGKGWTA